MALPLEQARNAAPLIRGASVSQATRVPPILAPVTALSCPLIAIVTLLGLAIANLF